MIVANDIYLIINLDKNLTSNVITQALPQGQLLLKCYINGETLERKSVTKLFQLSPTSRKAESSLFKGLTSANAIKI